MAWGMTVMSKRWFLILMPMSGSCMLTIIRSICRAKNRRAQPRDGPGHSLAPLAVTPGTL